MTKKKRRNTVLVIIIIAVVIFIMYKTNWENPLNDVLNNSATIVSPEFSSSNQNSNANSNTPWIELYLSPNTLCTGQAINGQVRSNLPNANCVIQYKLGFLPYQNLLPILLNYQGQYSNSTVLNTAGAATFRVVCGSTVSNTQQVTVNICSNPTYTCGQGSDQGFCSGTCPIGYSCYDITSANYKWCACATGPQGDGTGEIHPDWKPGAQYYNPLEIQLTCEQVVSPTSQADCDKAYDPLGGQCIYLAGGFGSYCASSME